MKFSTLLVSALLLGSANTAFAGVAYKGDLKFENAIQQSYAQTATPMVVTSDQNVVITGTQVVDNNLGSFVAKANSQLLEEPVWKLDITGGRSVVNAIVADENGGVYVGGNFNDEITIGGKTLTGRNSANYNKINGFVAHITKSGVVDAAYSLIVSANSEMMAAYPDAYSSGDKVYCSLTSLALVDGKPYAGVVFTDEIASADGDVTLVSGTWDCIDYGMGVGSDADFAVVELDPTTLEAKSFPVVFGGAGTVNTENYWGINVESAKMVSDGQKLYLAATVGGYYSEAALTVNGVVVDKPTFKYSGGLNAVYVACFDMTGNTCVSKVYDGEYKWSASTSSLVEPEVACLDLVGDNLYIGGSFYQNFPFNTSVAAVGNTDIYLASLNKSDLTLDFAVASGYNEKTSNDGNDEKFSCYEVVDGTHVNLYGAVVTHTDFYSAATTTSPLNFSVKDYAGTSATVTDNTTSDADFFTGSVVNDNTTYYARLSSDQTNMYYKYVGDPVNGITTLNADKANNSNAVYNLQGMKLRAPQKGLNIIGGKVVVVK